MHWLFNDPHFEELIWMLFFYMIMAVFLICVMTPRFNIAVTLLAMPVLWYVNMFIYHFDNLSDYLSQLSLLCIFVYSIAMFKDKIIRKMIFAMISIVTLFIADFMTFTFLDFFGNPLNIFMKNISSQILVALFQTLCFFIIYKICNRFFIGNSKSKKKKKYSYNLPFFIVILSEFSFFLLIFGTFVLVNEDNIEDYQNGFKSTLFIFVFIFLILDIIIYTTLKRNAEIQKKELYYKTLENQYKLEVDYYKKMQKSINETTKMRHDINNILQVIKIELANSSDEGRQKVSEFTDEIEKIMEKSKIRRFCENRIINTVLYDKSERAAALGIELDDNVFVGERCGVDDFDLCRVFINILDNATNALSGYIGDEKRIIHISCKEADSFLYIQCQNSYSEKDGGSQKKNGSGEHGFGLQIIEETAKKYGGELVTDSSNGVFSTLVTLRAGAVNPA